MLAEGVAPKDMDLVGEEAEWLPYFAVDGDAGEDGVEAENFAAVFGDPGETEDVAAEGEAAARACLLGPRGA